MRGNEPRDPTDHAVRDRVGMPNLNLAKDDISVLVAMHTKQCGTRSSWPSTPAAKLHQSSKRNVSLADPLRILAGCWLG
jgi:hypothetical protein